MFHPKIHVIAGLGNPGSKYEFTRHNLGFLVVEAWAEKHGWSFKDNKEFNARVAKGQIGENQVHLLLPTTYMNESGRAIRRCLDYYKLTPENLLVVADDVALPFNEMRLRRMGSFGGHNGLRSIENHLGTRQYARLRMGIGRALEGNTLADYVLDNFSREELVQLPHFVLKGTAVLDQLMHESIAHVMNAVNASKAHDLTSSGEHKDEPT